MYSRAWRRAFAEKTCVRHFRTEVSLGSVWANKKHLQTDINKEMVWVKRLIYQTHSDDNDDPPRNSFFFSFERKTFGKHFNFVDSIRVASDWNRGRIFKTNETKNDQMTPPTHAPHNTPHTRHTTPHHTTHHTTPTQLQISCQLSRTSIDLPVKESRSFSLIERIRAIDRPDQMLIVAQSKILKIHRQNVLIPDRLCRSYFLKHIQFPLSHHHLLLF